jgi:hypothetical protein
MHTLQTLQHKHKRRCTVGSDPSGATLAPTVQTAGATATAAPTLSTLGTALRANTNTCTGSCGGDSVCEQCVAQVSMDTAVPNTTQCTQLRSFVRSLFTGVCLANSAVVAVGDCLITSLGASKDCLLVPDLTAGESGSGGTTTGAATVATGTISFAAVAVSTVLGALQFIV